MSAESRAVARAMTADDLAEVERLCRQHGAALRASGELQTLFQYAACQSRVAALDLLRGAGAAADAPLDGTTGQTALYAATANGATGGVRWLLAHGAPVNQTVEGESRCLPLFVAARLGHAEIARLLVEAGAVTRTRWNGQSPAGCAAAHGNRDLAADLAAREAGPGAAADPAV